MVDSTMKHYQLYFHLGISYNLRGWAGLSSSNGELERACASVGFASARSVRRLSSIAATWRADHMLIKLNLFNDTLSFHLLQAACSALVTLSTLLLRSIVLTPLNFHATLLLRACSCLT
jgi:hypothetical protein